MPIILTRTQQRFRECDRGGKITVTESSRRRKTLTNLGTLDAKPVVPATPLGAVKSRL